MKLALLVVLFTLSQVVATPLAPAQVYGTKTNTSGLGKDSGPPTLLYSFDEMGAGFNFIAHVIVENAEVDADGLALSAAWGLLGWRTEGYYDVPTASWVVTGSTMISIDTATGVGTLVGSALPLRDIRGAVFDHSDDLWVVDAHQNELLQIDPSDGTVIGTPLPLTLDGNPYDTPTYNDIAIRCDGTMVLTGWDVLGYGTFYKLDLTTGELILVSRMVGQVHPGATYSKDARDVEDLFVFEAQGVDDINRYDSSKCFASTPLFTDILATSPTTGQSINGGNGDLAALVEASGCLPTNLCDDCNGNGKPNCVDINCHVLPCSSDINANAIPDECEIAVYCTAKTNSCGSLPSIGSTGVPNTTLQQGFMVHCANTKATKSGLLIYTNAGRAMPATPFLGGWLCLETPPLKRSITRTDVSGTPPLCNGVLSIDMNAFAHGILGGNPLPALLVPGTVVTCQFWGRDTQGNSLLSDALEYLIGQ